MLGEAIAAAVVGTLVLWLVLQPLLRPGAPRVRPVEPLDPEETPKGIALTALKEIEFDRETGKLSEGDYESLKAKYTSLALEAIRQDAVPAGPHGVSDRVEAMIAAKLRALRSAAASTSSDLPVGSNPPILSGNPSCSSCGPRPEADAVFCSSCGRRLPMAAACDRCGTALVPGSRYCERCGRQVAA
jgi:hypothetical protein